MEDQKEGVSDVWFQNELAKYPKVRADDWVGPLPREATAKVPPSPPSSSSSLPSATKPNQKNSRLPNHPSSKRSVHPFWSALRQELSIYYSEEDVEKIVDAFEGDYKRSVSSWSLDDIERVATALS